MLERHRGTASFSNGSSASGSDLSPSPSSDSSEVPAPSSEDSSAREEVDVFITLRIKYSASNWNSSIFRDSVQKAIEHVYSEEADVFVGDHFRFDVEARNCEEVEDVDLEQCAGYDCSVCTVGAADGERSWQESFTADHTVVFMIFVSLSATLGIVNGTLLHYCLHSHLDQGKKKKNVRQIAVAAKSGAMDNMDGNLQSAKKGKAKVHPEPDVEQEAGDDIRKAASTILHKHDSANAAHKEEINNRRQSSSARVETRLLARKHQLEMKLKRSKVLNDIPIFQGLDSSAMQEIVRSMKLETFEEGEELIREGDYADSFFIILSGSLGVYKTNTVNGEQSQINTLGVLKYLGEAALVEGDHVRTATVVAETKVELFMLSRRKYTKLKQKGVLATSLDEQFASDQSNYEKKDRLRMAEIPPGPSDAISDALQSASKDAEEDGDILDIMDSDEDEEFKLL
eukprot:g2632.t1